MVSKTVKLLEFPGLQSKLAVQETKKLIGCKSEKTGLYVSIFN